MCACDQNLDLPCQGNLRLNRCPTTLLDTRKAATVTCAVTRSAVDGGGASKVLGSVASTEAGDLLKGELVLMQHLHVIPANHLLKSSEIVLLSKGRWDTSLEEMPAYTQVLHCRWASRRSVPFDTRCSVTRLTRTKQLCRSKTRNKLNGYSSSTLSSIRKSTQCIFFSVPNTHASKLIWPTEFGTCRFLKRVVQSLSWQRKLLSTWMAFR